MKLLFFLLVLSIVGCQSASWEYVKPDKKKKDPPPILDPGDIDPNPNPNPNPNTKPNPNPPDPNPRPDPTPGGPGQTPSQKPPGNFPPLPPDVHDPRSECWCPYNCWLSCKLYVWYDNWRSCTPRSYWR